MKIKDFHKDQAIVGVRVKIPKKYEDRYTGVYGKMYVYSWWGQGIQRNYGLKEKRWSLFNTHKWSDPLIRPACCSVVPILYTGIFDTLAITACYWFTPKNKEVS